MISRRQFLVFLATLTTAFSTLRSVQGETKRLYLHNGWVLRTDDLVDDWTGE